MFDCSRQRHPSVNFLTNQSSKTEKLFPICQTKVKSLLPAGEETKGCRNETI